MAVGAFILSTFVSLIGAGAIDVRGETTCPRPSEVVAALERVTGPGSPEPVSDVAWLAVEDVRVVVWWRRGPGEGQRNEVRSKAIPPGLSCAERATAAAIIIAAWEARLVDPPAEPLRPAAPAERSPPAAVTTRTATVTRDPELAVSAAGLLSGNSAGFAGGALVEIQRQPGSWPFGVSAGALFVAEHAVGLGAGAAVWSRAGLTADVHRRFNWALPWLEARAGVVVSFLKIGGRQFLPDQGSFAFDPGITAGLRLGLSLRRASPWLHLGAALWPRSQFVHSTGGGAERGQLPRLEVLAGLGLSLGRGR